MKPALRLPRPLALALAFPLAMALALPQPAGASDFWDEVRTPGIGRYNELIAEGEAALRARRLADAERVAEEALALFADDARAYFVRGIAQGERGAVQHGAADIAKALELDEGSLDGFFAERATTILLKGGALAPASALLRRTVRAALPGARRDTLFGTYGDVLMAQGPDFLDAALSAYREAIRSSGGSPQTKLGFALAQRRQGTEGWRALAQDAANSMARQLLLTLDLPESERSARAALLLEIEGDRVGARNAWDQARSGPWQPMAEQASQALASE